MIGLDVAKKYVGLHEVRDNKQIKALLKSQALNGDIAIDPATTSWCAAWMNFCERESGQKGTGALNAQSFLKYGTRIKEDDAVAGDIIVFHFAEDADWQGHVTYFVSWDDDSNTVKCLGGNQHDSVDYSVYSQNFIQAICRS